ncbi:MAG: hypothetical protein MI725_16525 [Pirellulales bacterium]|nr:hypothetical protein [Pirellulales bacterium]
MSRTLSGEKIGLRAHTTGLLDSESLSAAISLLCRAARCAAEAKRDIWDFAVEAADLVGADVSPVDLRWLLAHGYVMHAQEISEVGEACRKFVPLKSLAIPEHACFVLTGKGAQLAKRGYRGAKQNSFPARSRVNGSSPVRQSSRSDPANSIPTLTPHWDPLQKQLTFASQVVKRFRCPAPNQETVLTVFQEEQWCRRIDDPLPPAPGQDCRRRLSDTIKYLNRKQVNALIRFRGDGTGKGVLWELREEE